MDVHISTTPFGRRPLSLAMVQAQADTRNTKPDTAAHKWHVWRNLTEAKERLNITDRSLAVLNALLSFHQETALVSGGDLVVFPSNRELSIRAHGMAPATLRRHLAVLVEAGLIIRRDSPNGKRYARKGQGGDIAQAFGFDLTPLVVRAAEIEVLAEDVRARRRACALMREQITLLRRDTAKTIEAGVEQNVPAPWADYAAVLFGLSQGLLRVLSQSELETRLAAFRGLYADVAKALAVIIKTHNSSVNESQSERHIQNSNPDPFIESEPCFSKKQGEPIDESPPKPKRPDGVFPLGMVLDACPDLIDYAKGGIASWRDFEAAVNIVRPMLGISPSAWQDALNVMGPIPAAIVVAAILQKGTAISSAGGYIRNLTHRAALGEFSLGPMLMALIASRKRDKMRA